MGRTRFFLLDSAPPPSLTLRDYSKVVAGYKLSLSRKNHPHVELVWRLHAVTATPLVESMPVSSAAKDRVPGPCPLSLTSSAALRPRHRRPHSRTDCRSHGRGSGRGESHGRE